MSQSYVLELGFDYFGGHWLAQSYVCLAQGIYGLAPPPPQVSYTPRWLTQFQPGDTIQFLITNLADPGNHPPIVNPQTCTITTACVTPDDGQAKPFAEITNGDTIDCKLASGAQSIVFPGHSATNSRLPCWSVELPNDLKQLTFAPGQKRFTLSFKVYGPGGSVPILKHDPEIFVGASVSGPPPLAGALSQ